MPPTSIFIYGSCVSRDAFNFTEEGSFQIVDYYARSSLVSALAPPLSPAIYPLEKITGKFRRRSVERDISKTLLHTLVQKSYNILLLDLIDERFHLVRVKRGKESYLTLSSEFKETQTKVTSRDVIRAFSELRNQLWAKSWKNFVDFCSKKNLLDKVCINKVFFATLNDKGIPIKNYLPEQLNEINNTLEFMYAKAAEYIPANQFLTYEKELFVANSQHRWGEAPFHYIDDLYQETLRQLNNRFYQQKN